MYGHPVATRASLVQAAQEIAQARSPSPARVNGKRGRSSSRAPRAIETAIIGEEPIASSSDSFRHGTSERTPLLGQGSASSSRSDSRSVDEDGHGHGHSHGGPGHAHGGSMNMRALVLHVLGDALGNVGVIATGLVIWLTDWRYKFYFDPVISLVITVIIFSSALPLGTSAFLSCALVV